jgi:hypothetical protein
MSRNTEYLVPSPVLPYLGAVRPAHLDDRYLCYILYNWLETGLEAVPQIFNLSSGENYFAESSLLRVAKDNYFLVANGGKGGSLRVYAKGKSYYDSGLEITSAHGQLSTGILDSMNTVSFREGIMHITGSAKIIKEPLLETRIAIVFKSWQLLFGRFFSLQRIIKKFLRSRMISNAKNSSVPFERLIEYSINTVAITDIVPRVYKSDIVLGAKAAYSAVPSSKYAAIPEISSRIILPDKQEKEQDDSYILKRTFRFDA